MTHADRPRPAVPDGRRAGAAVAQGVGASCCATGCSGRRGAASAPWCSAVAARRRRGVGAARSPSGSAASPPARPLRQLVLATRRQGWRGLVGRANGGMIVHIGVDHHRRRLRRLVAATRSEPSSGVTPGQTVELRRPHVHVPRHPRRRRTRRSSAARPTSASTAARSTRPPCSGSTTRARSCGTPSVRTGLRERRLPHARHAARPRRRAGHARRAHRRRSSCGCGSAAPSWPSARCWPPSPAGAGARPTRCRRPSRAARAAGRRRPDGREPSTAVDDARWLTYTSGRPADEPAPSRPEPRPAPSPPGARRRRGRRRRRRLPGRGLRRVQGRRHGHRGHAAARPGRAGRSPASTLDGAAFDLSSRRGSWVVLNFFASWCEPCKQEDAELVRFASAAAGAGHGRRRAGQRSSTTTAPTPSARSSRPTAAATGRSCSTRRADRHQLRRRARCPRRGSSTRRASCASACIATVTADGADATCCAR